MVFWLTGLSGAGKSTLGRHLVTHLKSAGYHPIYLDGDEIRQALQDPDAALGYDPKSRLRNAYRICNLARLLESQGFLIVVATMSLFHEIHRYNRSNFESYQEIWIKAPMETLRDRHPQQLYENQAKDVVGHDLIPEFPQNPNLVLSNSNPQELEVAHETLWQHCLNCLQKG